MKYEVGRGDWEIRRWGDAIAKKIEHGISALVLKDESALMELGLISPHRDITVGPAKQVASINNARITDLGIRLCETIQSYQATVEADTEA